MDLYQALLGSLGDENYYLSQDPFYQGASAIGKLRPTTDSEAIWGGLLQGALSGYGKSNANDTAREAYAQNPLLNALYTRPEGAEFGPLTEAQAETMSNAPEGWTAQTGRTDLALALIGKQSEQARQQKLDEALAVLDPRIVAAEAYKAGKIEKAKYEAQNPGVPGLEDIPKALQDKAIEEKGFEATLKESFDYIDQKFNRAKELNGIKAAMPRWATAEADEMEGLRQSTIFQADKAIGKEINSDVRKKLESLTPMWNDSDETIERKKIDMKDYIRTLNKETPILDAYGKSSLTTDKQFNGGVPGVGSSFNGEKVISVKKIS